MPKRKALTNREKIFCLYVIKWGNATRSAIKAGYSEVRARNTAYELMKRDDIKEYIEQIRSNVLATEMYDEVMGIQERRAVLTKMAMDESAKLKDRQGAIDILNKMDGNYTTNIKMDGKLETSQKFSDIVNQLGGKGLKDDE